MEPKEDEYTIPKAINEYLQNVGKGILADQLKKELETLTKYDSVEILYAVKEQIVWAGEMLKNKKWRKHLDSEELHVLQKIYKDGKYYESEKPLLNNILEKYNEE